MDTFKNITISSLSFSDKSEIKLSGDDLIIIVGSNNSGKSTALRDIKNGISVNEFVGSVVNKISLDKNLDKDSAWGIREENKFLLLLTAPIFFVVFLRKM